MKRCKWWYVRANKKGKSHRICLLNLECPKHDLKSCCGRTSSILVTSHQNEEQTKVLAHVPLIVPNPAQLQPSYPCMGFSPFQFYQNTRDTKKDNNTSINIFRYITNMEVAKKVVIIIYSVEEINFGIN